MFEKGQVAWNKGIPCSDETKKKMSDAQKKNPNRFWLGKNFSKEHKKKLIENHRGMLGKKQSETMKEIIRIKLRGRKPWITGKHHSPETREKIRKSNLGKKHSPETKKKLSEIGKTKIGQLASAWKGGVSDENTKIRHSIEYKLWQDSVLARDGYTCQKCHEIMRPYKLVGHHILNFSNHTDLRMAIDNGITFCRPCHKIFHMKYGFKNNTREQLEEFLND